VVAVQESPWGFRPSQLLSCCCWGLAPCGLEEGLHKPFTSLPCHYSPWRWTHVSPKRRHRPENPHSSRTQDFNNNNSRLVRLPHLCPRAYIRVPIIFNEQYKLFSGFSSASFAPHRSSYCPNHLVSDTLFPFLNVRGIWFAEETLKCGASYFTLFAKL
jgi:hypothetical protein